MSAHGTKFVAKCLPKHQTMRAVTVTVVSQPTTPGGSDGATTAGISALWKHQADLSPATQGPYQQRAYWIPTADVATVRRGDTIQQTSPAESEVWVVMDIQSPRGGMTRCQCRIGQVRA